MSRRRATISFVVVSLALVIAFGTPAISQTPKAGGTLNITQREDLPQGFAIHETSTISTVWPAMPCLNNLVLFDPLKKTESLDTIIGELAEKWSWQDNYRNLVFFHLKGPQPSLLMMLASGYTPVYAAHVPPANYRTACIGTGPFKLKEWRKGEFVEFVKNPDYFVKGRPYLDGLKYIVIAERGTRTAALQSGAVDVAFPGETTKTAAEQLKKAVPELAVTPYSQNVNDNIIMNMKKPPFNNAKVRLAVSRAIDRRALVQAVHQGGAVVGASMAPKPQGFWGLLDRDLNALPGYGKPADEKPRAKQLLAEAGVTPQNPLKVEMVTRAIAVYVDMASFVINELKQIGIEASLKQIETAQWHATATRGDYQIGANLTGIGPDDPDANYFENYACGSPRNYSFYCDEQVMKMIEQQSQELDPKKRFAQVAALQKKREDDAARPLLDWKLDYFVHRPFVKNLIPHQSIYNFGRMQEVWRDK